MSATHTYTVQPRTALGSKATAKLRTAGQIPVTLSRRGQDSLHLQIDAKQAAHFAGNVVHLCRLDLAGKSLTALRSAVATDCLTDAVQHIDLIEVDEQGEITVEVAVRPDARNCPGVKAGGIVEQRARKVKVLCKADAIPDALDVDLAEVQITETVYAEKLKLPAGVRLAVNARTPILTIVIPRQMLTAEEKPAEGDAAKPAEGAAGAEAKKEGDAKAAAPADAAKKDEKKK